MKQVSAIIADDESALRAWLKRRLSEIWPELSILGEAENGLQALQLIQAHHPDVAFLDIRMPGLTGMDVADKIAGACHIVFVTAYDQYAVDAFEKAAVDYLLKPITTDRLHKTVSKLKQRCAASAVANVEIAGMLENLVHRAASADQRKPLKWIRVLKGETVRLIPVDDVCYFQAQDKYTAVVTLSGEYLIRKPVRELAEELDAQFFWQIHRGTIVRVECIEQVSRSLTGRYILKLKDVKDTLTVSRTFSHRFKHM